MRTATPETVATETRGSLKAGDPLRPVESIALGVVFCYLGQRYLEHGLEGLGIGAAIRRISQGSEGNGDNSEVE